MKAVRISRDGKHLTVEFQKSTREVIRVQQAERDMIDVRLYQQADEGKGLETTKKRLTLPLPLWREISQAIEEVTNHGSLSETKREGPDHKLAV